MKIRTSDVTAFFKLASRAIEDGYTIAAIQTRLIWSSWRFVRVYEATLRVESKIKFNYGPVSERPLPPIPEGE